MEIVQLLQRLVRVQVNPERPTDLNEELLQ